MRVWLAAGAALAVAVACGDGDGDSGAGAAAGTAGEAGESGSGGMAGSAGSSGAGASSGSSGGGGFSGAAGSSGSGGSSCNDPGPEPNDTLPQATPVCSTPPCEISDCDGAGGTLTGVIGPGDVDLHAYFGNDKIGCIVNATATTKDTGYRLCVFVQCAGGAATELKSCKSGTKATGPGGLQGCCVEAPGSAEVQHNCPGLDDSAGVYMQIDQASACADYSVDYHF
jgi:hypothetical protein